MKRISEIKKCEYLFRTTENKTKPFKHYNYQYGLQIKL